MECGTEVPRSDNFRTSPLKMLRQAETGKRLSGLAEQNCRELLHIYRHVRHPADNSNTPCCTVFRSRWKSLPDKTLPQPHIETLRDVGVRFSGMPDDANFFSIGRHITTIQHLLILPENGRFTNSKMSGHLLPRTDRIPGKFSLTKQSKNGHLKSVGIHFRIG